MINLEARKKAFILTGDVLRKIANQDTEAFRSTDLYKPVQEVEKLIVEATQYNRWFTQEMVRNMILAIGKSLEADHVIEWLLPYTKRIKDVSTQKIVAVIMAGNIPAVGFHDFLSVLISGRKLLAKLSSDDDKLLPAISNILVTIEPGLKDWIAFEEGTLNGFEAVIATGSNNTARYFDYYFSKYPHLIRKNRNGVAVLDGTETEEELNQLTSDIFLYFGLGCRNVSKLYVPLHYDFTNLLEVIGRRVDVAENNKYFNNYEYNKAIYLINQTKHFDSALLLMTENEQIASPVSVLYYEYYQDLVQLQKDLDSKESEIQCVVSNIDNLKKVIPLGQSQQPQLWDYADGVDTMEFLLSID